MTFHSRLSHESQKHSLPVMQYKKTDVLSNFFIGSYFTTFYLITHNKQKKIQIFRTLGK